MAAYMGVMAGRTTTPARQYDAQHGIARQGAGAKNSAWFAGHGRTDPTGQELDLAADRVAATAHEAGLSSGAAVTSVSQALSDLSLEDFEDATRSFTNEQLVEARWAAAAAARGAVHNAQKTVLSKKSGAARNELESRGLDQFGDPLLVDAKQRALVTTGSSIVAGGSAPQQVATPKKGSPSLFKRLFARIG